MVGTTAPPPAQYAGGQASGGERLTGKVEHGVGAVVGSKALEARGAEKEQYVFSTFLIFYVYNVL